MLCMQVETMQSYGIAPTAMTADHGYIAAGAQRGMVRLMELIPPAPVSTSLMQKHPGSVTGTLLLQLSI